MKLIFCWLYRRRISRHVDGDESLSPRLERHVARCRRCQAHWDQQHRMASLLATHAANARRELPPFLHGKIMAAVRRSETLPERSVFSRRWAVAASAVMLLVAGWFALDQHARRKAVSPEPLAIVRPISTAEPFAKEASALAADARAAVQLLARNFVPTAWESELPIGVAR